MVTAIDEIRRYVDSAGAEICRTPIFSGDEGLLWYKISCNRLEVDGVVCSRWRWGSTMHIQPMIQIKCDAPAEHSENPEGFCRCEINDDGYHPVAHVLGAICDVCWLLGPVITTMRECRHGQKHDT